MVRAEMTDPPLGGGAEISVCSRNRNYMWSQITPVFEYIFLEFFHADKKVELRFLSYRRAFPRCFRRLPLTGVFQFSTVKTLKL